MTKKEEKEIPLWLDSYQDLFSDFDPRPYKKRAMSDDFLAELKRASRDKKVVKDVRLLVPNAKRNRADEKMIKKRFNEHFEKHLNTAKAEVSRIIRRGAAFVVAGIVLMIIATSILFMWEGKSFLSAFLVVLLEPGGWFLFWEGLNLIIFEPKEAGAEAEFYRKMAGSRINFLSY